MHLRFMLFVNYVYNSVLFMNFVGNSLKLSKHTKSVLKMSDSEEEQVIMALMDTPANHFSGSDSTNSSDSLFFDSDEEESRRKRSKIENYVEKTVKEYSNDDFKSHFRISRKTTYEIISLFEQSAFSPVYSSGRANVTAEKTFLLSLWYLSNRNSFREVSDRFGVSVSTAHNCLNRVLDFLLSVKNNYIIWPDHHQKLNMSQAFAKSGGIPGAIGAIDGSHIEIPKPEENQDSYVNRKGYHSLLLQGVVDINKRFIDVFCGEPGSLHDARLLRRSALYAKISENPGFIGEFFLLGDSAYPNLDWIITSFQDNGFLSEEQKLFNKRLSSKRVVVENAFGLLKGRFRRLKGLENLNLKLCSKIILGSCILHNICLDDKLNSMEDIEELDEDQPPNVPFRHILHVQDEVGEKINRQQSVFKKMFNL